MWTWHLVSGAVILVLLGLHMAVMHLETLLGWFNPAGGSPLAWANVVARGQSAFFLVTYVLLLGTALYHGLYGLRNILLEVGPSSGVQRGLGWLLTVVGLVLFVVGAWAAWASFGLSQSI